MSTPMPLKILSSVSIKRKLVGVIPATSLAVLGVTCAALLMFEIVSYRHTTTKSLSTIADVVAENSSAALMFDDRKLAEEIVSGLRVEPEISRAALFDENDDVVATYPSDLAARELPTPDHLGVVLHINDVKRYKPVTQGDRRVGTVFIQEVIIRSSVLRKLGREQLLTFVLQRVKPIMAETELLMLDIEVELVIEHTL